MQRFIFFIIFILTAPLWGQKLDLEAHFPKTNSPHNYNRVEITNNTGRVADLIALTDCRIDDELIVGHYENGVLIEEIFQQFQHPHPTNPNYAPDNWFWVLPANEIIYSNVSPGETISIDIDDNWNGPTGAYGVFSFSPHYTPIKGYPEGGSSITPEDGPYEDPCYEYENSIVSLTAFNGDFVDFLKEFIVSGVLGESLIYSDVINEDTYTLPEGCVECSGEVPASSTGGDFRRVMMTRDRELGSDMGRYFSSSYDYRLNVETYTAYTTSGGYHQRYILTLDAPELNLPIYIRWDDTQGKYVTQGLDLFNDVTVNGSIFKIEARNGQVFEFQVFSGTSARLKSVKDRRGYGYDVSYTSGWKRSIVNYSNGRSLSFTYTGNNLDVVTLPNGETIDYGYSSDNNLLTITYPGSKVQTYNWSGSDDDWTITTSTLGGVVNRVTTISNGRVLKIMENGKRIFETYENPSNPNHAYILGAGNILKEVFWGTSVKYLIKPQNDFSGNQWSDIQTYAAATCIAESSYSYIPHDPATGDPLDDSGLKNLKIRKNFVPHTLYTADGLTLTYEYDSKGRLKKKTCGGVREEYWSYNDFSQVEMHQDPDGYVSVNNYDALGNILFAHNGYTYDGTNHSWPSSSGLISSAVKTISYTYNSYNLLEKVTWPEGNFEKYYYTSIYRLLSSIFRRDEGGTSSHEVMSYQYDDYKRVKLSRRWVNVSNSHLTQYEYDARERHVKTTFNDLSTEVFDYHSSSSKANLIEFYKNRNGHVTRYEYDDNGRIEIRTDAYSTRSYTYPEVIHKFYSPHLPVKTEFQYLGGSNKPLVIISAGERREYDYDYRNRPVSIRRYPNSSTILQSDIVYKDNRLLYTGDSYGRRSYYTYYAADNLPHKIIRESTPGSINSYTGGDPSDFSQLTSLVRLTGVNAAYTLSEYDYTTAGRVNGLIDPNGIEYRIEYEAYLPRVEFAYKGYGASEEQKIEYTYDGNDRVTEVKFPRYHDNSDSIGHNLFKETFSYTNDDLLKTRTTALNETESYTYRFNRKPETKTDFESRVSKMIWHVCCGRLQATVDPSDQGVIYNNDYMGNLIHIIATDDVYNAGNWHNPSPERTKYEATRKFDARNRLTHVGVWNVDLTVQPYSNTIPMPSAGEGFVTEYKYYDDTSDTAISALKAKSPVSFNADCDGSAVLVISPNGEKTATVFDGIGRPIATGKLHPTTNAPLTWKTYTYDLLTDGYLTVTCTGGEGDSYQVLTDGHGRTVRVIEGEQHPRYYDYDNNGNLKVYREDTQIRSTFKYDALNRVVEKEIPSSTNDFITKYTYDTHNNLLSKTFPRGVAEGSGQVESYTYDLRDRLSTKQDRIQGLEQYTYSKTGFLKTVKDSQLNVTTYTPDDRDLVASITYEDGGIVSKTYDALSRLDSLTDQKGNKVEYHYDLAGRLENRKYFTPALALESTDSFSYDDNSRLLTASKGRYGIDVGISYDLAGRPDKETLTINATTYTTDYDYDSSGRLKEIIYPDNRTLTKEYDSRNLLDKIKLEGEVIADFEFDSSSRELSRTFKNGVKRTLNYNVDNTLQSILTQKNSYTYGSLGFSYTYDVNRNTTSETSAGTMAPFNWGTDKANGNSGFDELDRLVNFSRIGGGAIAALDQAWDLTPVGNWNNITNNGTPTTYGHNPVHETISIGGQSITYDDNGNMTNDVVNRTYEWDLDDLLKDVSAGGVLAAFKYDALGRRVSKNSGATETVYLYSGQQMIQEYRYENGNFENIKLHIYGNYIDDHVATLDESADLYNLRGSEVKIYRLYNPATQFHLWTASENEKNILTSHPNNWVYEGVSAQAYSAPVTINGVTAQAFFRLRNLSNNSYHFTTSVAERDALNGNGWQYENIAAYIFTTPVAGTSTFWRLFHTTTGEHLWTVSWQEYNALGALGWSQEGSAGNVTTDRLFFYHNDKQFNVRAVTNSYGDVIEQYAYTPYGDRTIMNAGGAVITQSVIDNNFGFTGQYYDKETDLWYFRARYFSSYMGRFISRDSHGYVDGMGLYNGYFAQWQGMDPSGHHATPRSGAEMACQVHGYEGEEKAAIIRGAENQGKAAVYTIAFHAVLFGGWWVASVGPEAAATAVAIETVEFTAETAIESATGVPVAIVNDPIDVLEQIFKKGGKEVLEEATEKAVKESSEKCVKKCAPKKLTDLQNKIDDLAESHLLPKYRKLDSNLEAGYTGSFKTGKVGNPNKDTFGQPINLDKFDVDYWIKSDVLYKKFGNSLKADVEFRKILSNTPGFEGLKPNKQGFSIKFLPSSSK